MGYDAQWIPEACKNVCLDLLPWWWSQYVPRKH
jgi:hypothetical protein